MLIKLLRLATQKIRHILKLFNIMNKNNFLYQIHCEEKNGKWYPSSKRFYGGIGFSICQLCILIATVLDLSLNHELSHVTSSLLDFDLAISASLIGLSTIVRSFGNNKTSIGNEKTSD